MIETPAQGRTKLIPQVVGILFRLGFKKTSWRIADWYMDRESRKARD